MAAATCKPDEGAELDGSDPVEIIFSCSGPKFSVLEFSEIGKRRLLVQFEKDKSEKGIPPPENSFAGAEIRGEHGEAEWGGRA